VIDPNEYVGELIAHTLRSHGYRVTIASRACALAYVEADSADVVLLDPTASSWEDGLALCRDIRACSGAPVLLVTSRCLPEDLDHALAAGAAGIVCKPFSPMELVRRVAAVVSRREATPR
jgi:DNA-binding response OmpR family regulator